MSVRAQTHAWELTLPPASKFVLLALADHADHAGRNIYPGIPLIAWKTGYSERHVTRIIGELLEAGILVIERLASGHTPTSYRIDFTAGEKQASHDARPVRRRAPTSSAAAEVTGCRPDDTQEGCQDVTPGVTSTTERGDIHDTRGVTSATERGDISDAEVSSVYVDATPKTDYRARMQPSWNRQGIIIEPPPTPPEGGTTRQEEQQEHALLTRFLQHLAQHPQFGTDVIRYPETIREVLSRCPDVATVLASYVALRARGDYIGKALKQLAAAPPAVGQPLSFPTLAMEPAYEPHPHERPARRRGPIDARHPGSFDNEDRDLLPDFLRNAQRVPTV